MTGELRERVTGGLKKGCPPEQVAGGLCFECNRGETDMSVSRETIYTWVYAQQKGGPASGGIIPCTGREQRKSRGR
jgi:IS30 family transposase